MPTPTIACVGLFESEGHVTPSFFQTEGDVVLFLGSLDGPIETVCAGSEFLIAQTKRNAGRPAIGLDAEAALQKAVRALVKRGLIQSAHDVADGGLAVALAECTQGAQRLGATIDATWVDRDARLFGECVSAVIVTCSSANIAAIESECATIAVPVRKLGVVGGDSFALTTRSGSLSIAVDAVAVAREQGFRSIVGE